MTRTLCVPLGASASGSTAITWNRCTPGSTVAPIKPPTGPSPASSSGTFSSPLADMLTSRIAQATMRHLVTLTTASLRMLGGSTTGKHPVKQQCAECE